MSLVGTIVCGLVQTPDPLPLSNMLLNSSCSFLQLDRYFLFSAEYDSIVDVPHSIHSW